MQRGLLDDTSLKPGKDPEGLLDGSNFGGPAGISPEYFSGASYCPGLARVRRGPTDPLAQVLVPREGQRRIALEVLSWSVGDQGKPDIGGFPKFGAGI